MQYPDGTEIPTNLPPSYRLASTFNPPNGDSKTIGENCENCKRNENGFCVWWHATIRNNYYCSEWARFERKKK